MDLDKYQNIFGEEAHRDLIAFLNQRKKLSESVKGGK
jgi:hypothetical protein